MENYLDRAGWERRGKLLTTREELRVSELKITVIKYLGNDTPVVVYEATEPAEIYTIPNYGGERWTTMTELNSLS